MALFDYIWAGLWGAGVLVEAVALAKRAPGKPTGTFSNFCRWLAGTAPHQPHWRRYPFGVALAALFVWFWGHVMLGWGP